jgi:integrase
MKDGKTRDIYAKTPKGLKEKVDKIVDLPISNSNKLTVDAWFKRWFELYVSIKKTATQNQYNDLYYVHVSPVIGHRKITSITTSDIQSVIVSMQKKVREKAIKDEDGNIIKPELKGYSTKTIRETIGVIRRGFDKAIRPEKLLAENPVKAKELDLPKKQAKPRKVLTIEELMKLYKAMENSRWIWSIRLLLVTGLRRGELLALKWTDIDFANKRLTVDESNSSDGLGDTKSAKVHYVPLSDKAISHLNSQKLMLEKEYNPVLHNDELKKSLLVFPTENGTMIRPDSYHTMLRRFAEKAEIKASAHCLRHTFVYLSRESMSLKELQAILGHDESTTTLDLYGDILEESMTKTANKIDDIFNKVEKEMEKIEIDKAEKENKPMGIVVEFKRKNG